MLVSPSARLALAHYPKTAGHSLVRWFRTAFPDAAFVEPPTVYTISHLPVRVSLKRLDRAARRRFALLHDDEPGPRECEQHEPHPTRSAVRAAERDEHGGARQLHRGDTDGELAGEPAEREVDDREEGRATRRDEGERGAGRGERAEREEQPTGDAHVDPLVCPSAIARALA